MQSIHADPRMGAIQVHTVSDTNPNIFPDHLYCFAIGFITDAEIDDLTEYDGWADSGDGYTGLTYPAGYVKYLKATAITLANADTAVECYLAPRYK